MPEGMLASGSVRTLLVAGILCAALTAQGILSVWETLLTLNLVALVLGLKALDTAAPEPPEAAPGTPVSFLPRLNHDLRSPLTAILGFSQLLEQQKVGPLSPKQLKYIDLIHKSGRDLLGLITDVVDLSELESGMVHMAPAHFEVGALLASVVTVEAGQARRTQVTVSVSSPEGLRGWGDASLVKTALVRLLNNAIKFSPAGGEVHLLALTQPEGLLLEVRDAGPGVKPEEQAEIFELFGRDTPGRSRPSRGLGLWLVRRLVQLHGGRVWVESSGLAGEGSRFRVRLPLPTQPPMPA